MAINGDATGLETLMFGGKPIVPQVAQGGFSRVKQQGVIVSNVAGGAGRIRRKYHGGVHVANVTFYLETAQHQDFMELFLERNAGKRFICHLAADRPIIEPYVVQIVSDSTFSEVTAVDATVSMTLEVFSARDRQLDEWLAASYPVYGDDLYGLINSYREIVELMPTP